MHTASGLTGLCELEIANVHVIVNRQTLVALAAVDVIPIWRAANGGNTGSVSR